MAETFVNVTEGSGKKLHAWDRTIGANTVLDEFMLPGEYPVAAYCFPFSQISGATANDHILQIMAGASLNVRIRRIRLRQHAAPAAVNTAEIKVLRLTTAGTGGTVVTASKLDNADGAAGATGMTLPTAKGTEGTTLIDESLWVGTAALPTATNRLDVDGRNDSKFIIPTGVANGIAIKTIGGIAALTWSGWVEIVETSFV